MTTTTLIIHIIFAATMVGIILIQKSEGGGLGLGSSTMGGLMSARGTANLLTRITAVLATLFFVTTVVLALLFKGAHKPKSILDMQAPTAPVAAPIAAPPSPTEQPKEEAKPEAAPQPQKEAAPKGKQKPKK